MIAGHGEARCAIDREQPSGPEPSSLLERCKANEPAAWVNLFERCGPRVHRWSVLLGLRANEAEDVVQEVLATVARRIQSCESDRVLMSWIYQITRRIVANARRSHWIRRILLIADGNAPEQDEPVAPMELELTVRSCLHALPLSQAEVLVLSELEGLTRKEIADLLELPEGTVASRLRLGKQAFLRCWARVTGRPITELVFE